MAGLRAAAHAVNTRPTLPLHHCRVITKQRLARSLQQGHNGRVLELSLHRNGVEALTHVCEASNYLDTILLLDFCFNHRGGSKHPQAGLAEDCQEGAVFEFPNHAWANVGSFKPLLKGTSDHSIIRG